MKKALSVAALVLGLTGSALAADLPHYKAPPPPPLPPPPLWTGFYVGLNAGGTWSSSNASNVGAFAVGTPGWPHGSAPADTAANLAAASLATSAIASVNNSGFIGGGQIGYNWQFMNSFVAGVEADIQGIAGGNNRASSVGIGPVPLDPAGAPTTASNYLGFTSVSKRLDYLGTVRGRLGWLFTPTLLVYGTGGLAYGGVNFSHSVSLFNDVYSPTNHIPATFGGSAFSDTRVGWTAGGGLEWMFMPNWSAKVEYLYYDLGSVTTAFALPLSDTLTGNSALVIGSARTRFNGNIVRAGVNYHFNWGAAPVVAKY
ncbi:outer membrane protein [Methylocystis suflitae]|uniref:outer membrane protein n=1 Tax=Methylocystis suflitae TaxID=2951405 RepID=UPI00210EDD21|nr:outer membrane beta-barrel protein [Methylocystis suflitae]MCQ4190939.1 outer membrane beta-barrel protein [Methylocystis suflitae]